jgi:hypothetical protein
MPATKLFLYEHKTQPLLPLREFYKRVLRNVLIAVFVLVICLLIGTVGYHHWSIPNAKPPVSWLDAFHNASMILSGMGPVLESPQAQSDAFKIFSSLYALFSGVIFVTNIGLMLAPAIHRLFHRFHLQEK